MSEPPLSDDDVYELLHTALLSFSNREVQTKSAQDVLTLAIKQMELLQRALLILQDGPNEPPET